MGLNRIIKTKRLYMLFLLPFIGAGMAFIGQVWQILLPGEVSSFQIIPLYDFKELSREVIIGMNFFFILLTAYLIFYMNARYKLLIQITTLPSLLYVLLTSTFITHLQFSSLLVSVFFIILGINCLQSAINNIKTNSAIFDFGFCMVLAVFFCPKLILLLLWSCCVLLFSGRSTIKDISALLLGIITPTLFLVFVYFWLDRLEVLPELFLNNLLSGEFVREMPLMELIHLGILAVLFLLSLYAVMAYYPVLIVNQRRGILSILSFLLFTVATLLVIPGIYYDIMYVLALPLSLVFAHFFITSRLNAFANLMFLLLLASCILC